MEWMIPARESGFRWYLNFKCREINTVKVCWSLTHIKRKKEKVLPVPCEPGNVRRPCQSAEDALSAFVHPELSHYHKHQQSEETIQKGLKLFWEMRKKTPMTNLTRLQLTDTDVCTWTRTLSGSTQTINTFSFFPFDMCLSKQHTFTKIFCSNSNKIIYLLICIFYLLLWLSNWKAVW